MTADREWVRRRFWSHGEPWHLRIPVAPSRRAQSSDAACGDWFWSSEALAIWEGEAEPPHGDRCGICAAANVVLQAIDGGSPAS